MTFDEGQVKCGIGHLIKSQKEPVVVPNNYEEEIKQGDAIPEEQESSNKPRRRCQLPSSLEDYVVGNDNNSSDENNIHFVLLADCEPDTFEKALGDEN